MITLEIIKRRMEQAGGNLPLVAEELEVSEDWLWAIISTDAYQAMGELE